MSAQASATVPDARISQQQARSALDHIIGMRADEALQYLSFSPSGRCIPVMRVLSAAVEEARATSGSITEHDVLVVDGEVGDGEVITRVRRHSQMKADWITTNTTRITVQVSVERSARLTLIAEREGQETA